MNGYDTARRKASGKGQDGVTFIEMLAALTVLAILATVSLPLLRWEQKRRDEARLRTTLRTMRSAIDQYKKYADEGLIVLADVDQRGYPRELEDLVEGIQVGDPESPEAKKITFLQRIPVDPMTGTNEWGLRSYQDEWDSTSWGGENVYDVYSLSDGRALDGTYYREW